MSRFIGFLAGVLALIALPALAQTISQPNGCVAGVACQAASVAVGGATLGSNAMAVAGNTSFTGAQNVFTNPIWVGNGVVSGCQDPTGPNGDGNLFCADTSNNVMELQQLNASACSAIGIENTAGIEQMAWGQCGPNAPAIFRNTAYMELGGAADFSIIPTDGCGRTWDFDQATHSFSGYACSGGTGTAYGTQTYHLAGFTGNSWSSGTLALGSASEAASPNLLQLTSANDNRAIKVIGGTLTGTMNLVDITGTLNGAFNNALFNMNITDTSHGSGMYLMSLAVGGVQQFGVDISGNVNIIGTLAPGAVNVGGGGITTYTSTSIGWQSRSYMVSGADGEWGFHNNAATSAIRFDATGTPAPTGTGTPTIAASSTDTAGEVTAGASATSVVITFATAKTNAPFCTVTPQTQLASFAYTISTTAITITQPATSGNKIDYVCVQH
jgi:hypothetical protein